MMMWLMILLLSQLGWEVASRHVVALSILQLKLRVLQYG